VKQEQLFDVRGHAAFVTGAASGLGLAFAEVMAMNGARVMLTDIDADGVVRETERLRAMGCEVCADTVDIGDAATLCAAMARTAREFGRLDAVFANAGVSAGPGFALSPAGGIEAIDRAAFQKVLDINLTATIVTLQYAAGHMKKQRGGSIIVTSSIGGMRAEPMVGYGYAATKAALNNIVRQAAIELAPFGVRVNAIAPGPFLTNIGGGRLHREPAIVAQFAGMVPLRRLGQPDEIKGLALLLASPAGRFITGAIIPVDGGTTAE
jgi:NAD(P)-dependent dehydrogenase (short-subunit alcohol dehydrogenase family)